MPHLEHSLIFKLLKNKEIDELYLCLLIKYIAISMIGIFVPIYLITKGFSLGEVFLFYILIAVAHVIGSFFSAGLASKIGLRAVIFISMPFLVAFYILLSVIGDSVQIFYITAPLFGLHSSFFWTSFHASFSKLSDKKERGKETSILRFIIKSSEAVGPFIGGLFVVFFGFTFVFILTSLLILASSVPLIFSKRVESKFDLDFKGVLKSFKLREFIGFFGFGIDSVGNVLWPVFLFFIVLNSYISVGIITSVSLFISLFFIILVGFISDNRRVLALKLGSFLNSMVWIFKIFARTPFLAYFSHSLQGITSTASHVPFDASSYDRAKKSKRKTEFTVLRETIIHSGRAFTFLVLFAIFSIMNVSEISFSSSVVGISTIGFIIFGAGSLLVSFFE